MFDHFSTNNHYCAPSALAVAARAREMEKQWRLAYDLESARRLVAQERWQRAGTRRLRFAQAVQWLKARIFSRPPAEQRPTLVENPSAESPC